MNTLPRAITARFFATPDRYLALRQHWSTLMNSHPKPNLTAAHHTLYLALIGKDWRKGFTPVTNQRKLANGAYCNWGLFRALYLLHSEAFESMVLAPFDGLVTPQMLRQVRSLLPQANPYTHPLAAFANGEFPFEAYRVPTTSEAAHA